MSSNNDISKILQNKAEKALKNFSDVNPNATQKELLSFVDGFSAAIELAVEVLNDATKYEKQ